MVSTSTSSIQKRFKYDVFLSFRGEDTRKNFVDHLYNALEDKGIYTYKDDEKIKQGKTINNQLIQAIKDSIFFIIVFSKKYASSSWCLDELVEIMDCQKTGEQTAYPVFFDVEPTEIRKQSGAVKEAFAEHKKKEAAGKWREALKEASNLAGWECKATANGHEAEFIKKIVGEISLELRSINFGFDENLVGMETRVKDIVSSLELGADEVRIIGIKGMGGAGKTTTARAVFDHLSNDFEAKSFVENVREVSNGAGLKKLQEHVLLKVLNEHVTLDSVNDGKNMMKRRMCGKKVLLVLDDVDHLDQLEALANEHWFMPGSRILITTRDEQVLVAHGVKFIRDIYLLSDREAYCLLSRYAFGRENPVQGYEELSGKVVRYAAGLPLTVRVLGSSLCGKEKDEWEDAIERLNDIPLEETLQKLELSYMSLESDYKEIFLYIACILKGCKKEDAIRILECCGFHARYGLKVLELRSLIVNNYGMLGMHDHIEEMGKYIVRRKHLDEPNKHSHLWIDEEIEDILANDMGTEATRCLKLKTSRGNSRILMKGLGKMEKLRYLEVNLAFYDFESDAECLDDTRQYLPNSLKYLKCWNYPFLYLPRTFQANNLVGLDMYKSRMVQLWEDGEKKILKKLKFLSLYECENLTTFDFGITPNLETLILEPSCLLVELCTPVICQKLNHLSITSSKLTTFDLRLIPNLETLTLDNCADFVKLQVSTPCTNLKFLNLRRSRVRSLDLELFPNLESLDLQKCDELVEFNAPNGCLKKLVKFDLSCLRFTYFVFRVRSEPKVSRSAATLDLVGESLDLCPLHPNSNLPKLRFRCSYEEYLPSSVGNIEKLISFGLFIDGYLLEKLPEDLGKLECLEKLFVISKKVEYLPDSICMLKRLKELCVTDCCRLGKLPEDIGQLESLEKLYLSATTIKHLPESICMLKHLKYLNLSLCALLEKLPEDLGLLECLEELIITDTCISRLPQSIFGLKRLLLAASEELLQLYYFPSEISPSSLNCLKL
ncbi:disease resistance TIR-NBS-LRR class family protein [Tanacetum coccineum]